VKNRVNNSIWRTLRRLIKWIFSLFLYFSGYAYINSLINKNNVRILVYHRINNDKKDLLSVNVKSFEKQMQFLKENYNIISLNEMLEYFEKKKHPPPNSVVITFDDGYKDNYTNAFPILQKYSIPATIFLVYNYIGKNILFKWDSNVTDKAVSATLNWTEIIEMSKRGIHFGAHTITHPILTEIPFNEAKKEIRDSKLKLEEHLGKISLFAYPRGEKDDFNENIKKVVECHFSCACTTISGTNNSNTDRFALKRTVVEKDDESLFMFKLLMNGTSDIILSIIRHSYYGRKLRKILKLK